MKVNNLHVDGFGVWTGLDLQALSHRVTIVFGANETGKTTLMQFIRTMFYGFSPERRGRYLPPVHGGRAGGSLDLHATHGALQIQRHLDRLGEPDEEESLRVQSAEGTQVSVSLLSHLLAGVDEATFTNVFAVGLRELQELGTLDDTKAADLLYKLTTGLDRVSLIDVMRDLDAVRRSLFDPQDDASRIPALMQRRAQLETRIAAVSHEGRQWVELQTHIAQLDTEARELEERTGAWGQELKVLDIALRVRDLWSTRRTLRQQLDAIGQLRDVPDTALKRLESLREEAAQYEREVAELQRRRREFRREVAGQPINRALWAQAPHIETLVEMGPWLATLQSQVDQTRIETRSMETRLTASSGKLGLRGETGHQQLPELSPGALAALQRPARVAREEMQRLKETQAEHEVAQRELVELTAQVETALLDRGHDSLTEAVEVAGSAVSRLRRRVQLDARLEQLSRQWTSARRERRTLLEEQVLSPPTLAWLGVPFVVGAALLVGGLVWSQAAMLGWPMAALGLFGWLASVVGKISLERAAARELEGCDSQLETLKSQLRQARQEQTELDAQLPPSSGTLDVRLATAERELTRLEELLPLEANLQAARQRALAAERRVEQLEGTVKEAQTRWRTALRQLHLPEDMSPQEVKQLADGTRQVLQSRHELDNRREELSVREREFQTLTTRINQLSEKVALNYSSPDPQVQLQRLAAALAEQQTLYERRQELRQEDRRTRRQIRQLSAKLKKCQAERHAIISHAGVRNEKELRDLLARLAERRKLVDALRDANNQYAAALGKDSPVARVEQELADHPPLALEERRASLTRQTNEARAQLAAEAGAVSAGERFRPLPVEGATELRRLISTFNQMVTRLEEQQISIRQYTLRVLHSQEEERTRISRDLQDETIQDLIALIMRIEFCRSALDSNPAEGKELRDEIACLKEGEWEEARIREEVNRALVVIDDARKEYGKAMARIEAAESGLAAAADLAR